MATLGGRTLDDLQPVTIARTGKMDPTGIAAICETAWLDAQMWAVEVRNVEGEIMNLLLTIERATVWLSRAERTHPRYTEARQRKSQLERALDRCNSHLRSHANLCWQSCIDLHVALNSHRNPHAWIDAHPAELALFRPIPSPVDRCLSTDLEPAPCLPHPATRNRAPAPPLIWDALMGDRPAPGSWPLGTPAEDRKRLTRVEPWHRDWIRERLQEWQRAGVPSS